jgi:hypothetical protein
MKQRSRPILGIILVIIGSLFLLQMLGIISFSVWSLFTKYWPVLLIFWGLSIIFRRWSLVLGLILVMLIVIGLAFYSANQLNSERTIVQKTDIDPAASSVNLAVHYGAGDLKMSSTSSGQIINNIKTTELSDPKVTKSLDNNIESILIEKNEAEFGPGGINQDSWDIMLPKKIPYSISLNYGAANADIDLSGLMVDTININSGAASTDIIFAAYPTKATIDTGASSVNLKFPKNIGVIIKFSGGLASSDFRGFVKNGDTYYSSNYDSAKDNIEVEIHAGASSVTGEFY